MDSSIRSSENEFRSQVISWLNAAISRGGYPFEFASADPSLATSHGTRFPDIELWINREAHEGFCGWELKQPTIAADDTELIENAIEKAVHMRARYFVTWNMRDAVIWDITDAATKKAQRIFSCPPLQIRSVEDLKIPTQRIALEERAQAILDDLAHLFRDGHLTYIGADDWFFIHRLINTTRAIHSLNLARAKSEMQRKLFCGVASVSERRRGTPPSKSEHLIVSSILEIVRTVFAPPWRGEESPPRKIRKAAEPHR